MSHLYHTKSYFYEGYCEPSSENIDGVLDILSELGVTVPSDKKVSFENTEKKAAEDTADTGTRYSEDIEEGNVRQEFDGYAKRYPGAPIVYIRSDMGAKELVATVFGYIPSEVSDEEVSQLASELLETNKKTQAFYNPFSKNIVIFADRNKDGHTEERYFHENLHAQMDALYGDVESNKRGIAERFWDASPDKLGRHSKTSVVNDYPEWRQKEEYFVRCLSEAMHDGDISRIENLLEDAGDRARLETLLNELKYDRRREERARKESKGRSLAGKVPPSNEEVRRVSEHKSRIAEHIARLLDKLGTKDRTTVYHSLDELPEADRKHVEERHRQGKKVCGWYRNGKVYLFLPDIGSEYEAEQVIWHETVAHHGLRELIGKENYDRLLSNYQNIQYLNTVIWACYWCYSPLTIR